MDNFETLKRIVNNGRVSDTQFALRADSLDSQDIGALAAKYLEGTQLALGNYTVTESDADQSVKVTGTGSKLPFTGMSVEATFKLSGTEPTLFIRATGAGGWNLASAFPIFKNSLVGRLGFGPDAALSLASYNVSNEITQNLLFFEGTLGPNPALSGISALFGESPPKLSGAIDIQHGVPSMTLGAPLGAPLDLGLSQPLALTFEVCSVPVTNGDGAASATPGAGGDDQPDPPDATAFLRFRSAIPFKAQSKDYSIPLAALIYDPRTKIGFDIDLENFAELVTAGLDELASLTGETTLSDKLPKLDNFKIAELITLKNLLFQVNPSASPKLSLVGLDIENTQPWTIIQDQSLGKSITLDKFGLYVALPMETKRPRFTVSGKLDLGAAGIFVLSAFAPDFAVMGGLAPGASVNLREVIEYFVGSDTSEIPELEIVGLDFYAQPGASYSLSVDVDGDWPISLGFTELKIEEVKFSVDYTSGASTSASLGGRFSIGGVDLSVTAQHPGAASEWVFTSTAATTAPLDLVAVIDALLPAGIELPDELSALKLSNLSTSWNTKTKRFTFSGEADFSVKLGAESLTTTLTLNIDSVLDPATQARSTTGALTGDLKVRETDFKLSYEFKPTEKILRGTWTPDSQGMGYERLARSFNLGLPELDDIVPDLGLKSASFVIDYSQTAGESFIISAESTNFGTAFFMVGKDAGGAWGFAFGVALPPSWKKLSQLPGDLGRSLKPVDFMEFESAFFMISSGQFNGFRLPGFPGLGTYPMQVSPGLVCGAVIDFTKAGAGGDENSVAVKNLHGMTGKDVLLLSVTLSSNPANISLAVGLEGSVAIKGAGGSQITLTDTAVVIRVEPLAFTLRGSVEFPLQNQRVLATGYLTVSPTQAVAAFDVRAEDKYIPIPMGFKGVHLTEVGVAMGAVFQPPSVMLGLEGNFVIGEAATPGVKPPPTRRPLDAMPAADQFVFVFNATAEAVNPLLLSMYLAEVSLQTLITALLDRPAPGLPSVLTDIKASQLMLYWCDAPPPTFAVMQPDGTLAFAGTGFNADLDLWGFHAHASLKIDPTKGFEGDAYMDPLHIDGVIDVTGDGKGTPATYKGPIRVAPGGAVIRVSTISSPYLHINWKITLFNLLSEAVDAELTRDGFTFRVEYKVGSVFDSALSCSLKREDSDAALRIQFSIRLNLKIGPIKILGVDLGTLDLIDVGLAAALFASVGKDGLLLTIDGSFTFDGKQRTMPQIRLRVAPKSLEELPELIAKKIADEAETIFKDLYDEAQKYVQEGLDEAAKLGKEAEAEAKRIGEETEKMVSDLKRETDQAVAQIGRDAEEYAKQTLAAADKLVQETYAEMQRVEKAYQEAGAEIERLAEGARQEAERTVHQGEQAAQKLADKAAQEAKDAAGKAKQVADDVGDAVKEGAKDTWKAVKKY